MDRPRFFYRNEIDDKDHKERQIVVAYEYDSETGVVRYGASIFRKDRDNEAFLKAPHRDTAEARFRTRPVTLTIGQHSLSEVEEVVRTALRDYGVRGRRSHSNH